MELTPQDKPCCIIRILEESTFTDYVPGGMVRTETRLGLQSGNGPLVDWSSPIKNLCSTGLL